MKWLILLAALVLVASSIDDGDWVDPFDLPIPFAVHPFYSGYLKIDSVSSLYYVYTPS